MKKLPKNTQGFTLIEILVVIGLIAVLTSITVIAITPSLSFQEGRNAERRSEVTQILSAISQYIIDGGEYADFVDNDDGDPLPACGGILGNITSADDGANNSYDVSTSLLVPDYIASIPEDPTLVSGDDTGYDICIAGSGTDTRVTLEAPGAENGESIIVSR